MALLSVGLSPTLVVLGAFLVYILVRLLTNSNPEYIQEILMKPRLTPLLMNSARCI